MDLNKLSPAERIIAGSGVALVVISLLPWFGLEGTSGGHTGWSNPLSSFGIIVGILMVVQIGLSRFTTVTLPKPPVPWGRVHLILGVLSFALILLQALVGDEVTITGLISVTLKPKVGLYLGVLAAAGLGYGGFRRSKEPETAPGFL